MARRVECGKFKVIEVSAVELTQFGGLGICDNCGKASDIGYLIPVLNRWFCPECYESWKERARWYPEDAEYEQNKFDYYCELLNIG